MKIGDVSRHRRISDPARRRWYAHHRAVRFARRMRPGVVGGAGAGPTLAASDRSTCHES
jgi:hypothetical protein